MTTQSDYSPDHKMRLRHAADIVLASAAFQRSPTLSRLLTYLVEATLNGDAGRLKSYTVAIDGLGRDPHDDAPDGYARVQIARLRKALITELDQRPDHADGLVLDPGSYVVRLVDGRAEDADVAPPEDDVPLPLSAPISGTGHTRPNALRRAWSAISAMRYAAAAVLAVLVLLAGIGAFSIYRPNQTDWRKIDFPAVRVALRSEGPTELPDAARVALQREVLAELAQFETIRAIRGDSAVKGFLLEIDLDRAGTTASGDATLIDERTNRVVWSGPVSQFSLDNIKASGVASQLAFTIGRISGPLHSYSQRLGVPTDTPYGCWLRFASAVEMLETMGDRSLQSCSARWYATTPNHPVAAAIHGWVLVDDAIGTPSEDGHNARLEEAVHMLDDARLLDGQSALLRVSGLRAHAFAGDREQMTAIAHETIALGSANPDIGAFVSMNLAFYADPQADALAAKAFQINPNPPAWYHLGPAISAMMRDDPGAMAKHMGALDRLKSKPFVAILVAAEQCRSGNIAQATTTIKRMGPNVVLARMGLKMAVGRAPISSDVRDRLKAWLHPLLV